MANRPPKTLYEPPEKPYSSQPSEARNDDQSRQFQPVEHAAGQTAKAARAAARARRGRARRVFGITAGVLFLLLAGGVAVTVMMLPGCIKAQCIAAAASRGVTLGIADVELGTSWFTLTGVTASAAELPGISVSAPEVEIRLAGLHPSVVTVRDAVVTVAGSFDGAKLGFATWRKKNLGGDGGATPTAFPRIVADGVKVEWTDPFGAGKLEALAVHAEVTDRGAYDEMHVMAPRVSFASKPGTPRPTVGPWRIDYDRDQATARIRVAFDPEVPDGANALLVGDGQSVTSLDVTVPRTALGHLGVDPAALGLPPSESTQLEAKIQYRHAKAGSAEARAIVHLYGVKLASLPVSLDAALDAYAVGDPDKELDVTQGKLSFGPLSGAVTGAIEMEGGGVHVDASWKAGPVPCAAFLTMPAAPGAPPDPVRDLRQQLGQFAAATGLAKVGGELQLDAHLVVDTRDVGQTALRVTPVKQCL